MSSALGLDNVVYKRFINTPTLKELSDEVLDKEDIDEKLDEVEEEGLSNEYDKASIEGNETLHVYRAIFARHNKHSFEQVAGNEGFFESLLNWIKKIFTGILNFFKSLFGFNGSSDKYMSTKKELKGMKFEVVKSLDNSSVTKFTPKKSLYNLVTGPTPPDSMDFMKQLIKDMEVLKSFRRIIQEGVDKVYKSSLDLVVVTEDLLTGEEKSRKSFINPNGDDGETHARKSILNAAKNNGGVFSYNITTQGVYKVDIVKKSNAIPSNVETKEIFITKGDLKSITDLSEKVEDMSLYLVKNTEDTERNLKEITTLKTKLESKVKELKDKPEELKKEQEKLKHWVEAFNFWKYWHGEFTNKIFVRSHDALMDLLRDINNIDTKSVVKK